MNFDNKINFSFGFTPDYDGFKNMEIDRYLGQDNSPVKPIIRFFTWDHPTISIGHNQNPQKRLNLKKCMADTLEVVRRPTGGREILHGYDLCFSVIWPFSSTASRIDSRKLFDSINQIIAGGLKRLGIDSQWKTISIKSGAVSGPCFAQVDRGEITIDGCKLVASAQRTFDSVFLQQSSIPLTKSKLDIIDYMKHNDDEKNRIRNLMRGTETTLERHFSETISTVEIVDQFRESFEESFGSKAETMDHELKSFNEYYSKNKKLGKIT